MFPDNLIECFNPRIFVKNKICLVLGAGASKAYELPLGYELRNIILSLKNDRLFEQAAEADPNRSPLIDSKINKFIDAFHLSQKYSIDSFLARSQNYSTIGKLAIAHILLRCESTANLYKNKHDGDNWYQYFWNKISDMAWDDFDVSHISIVTFNYDRSLERYLTTAAINTYNKSLDEVGLRLSKMNIVHVYGSLGPQWPWEKDYLEYGKSADAGMIRFAANAIDIIPEARDDSSQLSVAISALKEARKIAFLGFGFDSLNMHRLDLKESCKVDFLTEQGWIERDVYFTCLGLEPEEAASIAAKLDKKLQSQMTIGYPLSFYDSDCSTLLRKTQFFD